MTNAHKVIHEAMGHVIVSGNTGPLTWNKCSGCGKPRCSPPDYTDPVHYCALMDWMRGKEGKFDKWLGESGAGIWSWLNCSRQEQVNLIAEAIEVGVLK